jgi:hypothetical protein
LRQAGGLLVDALDERGPGDGRLRGGGIRLRGCGGFEFSLLLRGGRQPVARGLLARIERQRVLVPPDRFAVSLQLS